MRKGEARFKRRFKEVARVAYSMAKKHARYHPDSFSVEDLVQEAMMVLLRITKKFPRLRGSELIALFVKSLRDRYYSLFRPQSVRHDNRKDRGADMRLIVCPSPLLPWDWYIGRLKILEGEIGKGIVRKMVKGSRRGRPGKEFEKRKEVISKVAQG